MKRLICADCGKRYDFDVDDFCPRCGSFNQPQKKWGFDANGNVIRVDGVNESNHAGSFVHKEVHREKVVRAVKGLERDLLPPAKKVTTSKPTKEKPPSVRRDFSGERRSTGSFGGKKRSSLAGPIIGTLLALFALLMESLSR